MKQESNRTQDRADDGRYTFDGNLERLCVCGHTLGVHSGGAPHDCLAYSDRKHPEHDPDCRCPKFRLSRRKAKP